MKLTEEQKEKAHVKFAALDEEYIQRARKRCKSYPIMGKVCKICLDAEYKDFNKLFEHYLQTELNISKPQFAELAHYLNLRMELQQMIPGLENVH